MKTKKTFLSFTIKRIGDILLSLIGILLFMPIWVVLIVLIKRFVSDSVFFCQTRIGWRGKEFVILKFRTLRVDKEAEEAHDMSRDEERLTTLGRWLRRTKLDEAPQLWNILVGQMSFVGPRPFIVEQSEMFPDRRLAMRPGLTGLSQIYGNRALSWEHRGAYDLYYVNHFSIWLDLKILAKTVRVILFGEERCAQNPAEEVLWEYRGTETKESM